MDQFKGWRTIASNSVVLLICVLVALFVDSAELKAAAVAGGIIAIQNLGLRTITSTAVGKSQ